MIDVQAAIAAAKAEVSMVAPVAIPVVPGRVMHVDGDFLCYWAGGGADSNTGPGRARQAALGKIDMLRSMSGSESVIVHLTASGSIKANRFIIATVKPYQGQRAGSGKPPNWRYLRDFFESHPNVPGLSVKMWGAREADDGFALVSAQAAAADKLNLCCLAYRDKDMRMLPGLHINWETFDLIEVPAGKYSVVGPDGLQYGRKWFWLQLLMGDTADHIPGLPKYIKDNGKPGLVGEATAIKLLSWCANSSEAFETVRGLYEGYYADEWADRLMEQGLLLWLRNDLGATEDNIWEIFPRHPHLERALTAVKERIHDARQAALAIGTE